MHAYAPSERPSAATDYTVRHRPSCPALQSEPMLVLVRQLAWRRVQLDCAPRVLYGPAVPHASDR